MLTVLFWYLWLALLGWLAFPIAFRFLGKLPDRGYTLARALGLLLWGFVFWLSGSYGLLPNNLAGLLTALLVLAGLSYWVWRGLPKGELRAWLKANGRYLLGVEALFLLAFAAMVLFRASNPDVFSTEKPMEMAFINAILHSPVMPPHDPWLSGYSISYYYFGFLMVAMLAQVTGAAGGMAFSLGIATTFAMAALGAYGLAYNLLTLRRPAERGANAWWALLAPLMVLILGNVEGLLEILHARHLFAGAVVDGQYTSGLWAWLDIKDLVFAPSSPPSWAPRFYGTGQWWWWRASRVLNDVNFNGVQLEVIDEIPAFSYVLGDLHPHVLAMPYAFLAAALAFQLYAGGADRKEPLAWLGVRLRPDFLLLVAVVLGGQGFLNIWDLPIYLVLFSGIYAFSQAARHGWAWERIEDFLRLLVVLGLGGVLLYLPFYLGFSSQAGGVLPNLLNPTRGAQLWVMFGTLLLPLFAYLIGQLRVDREPRRFVRGFLLALGLVAGLWILSLAISWIYATFFLGGDLANDMLARLGAPDVGAIFSESLRRRFANSGGWITLILLLALLLGCIWPRRQGKASRSDLSDEKMAQNFHLLLALFAALLVVAPEFVYLRDQFGTRMNTVFKFYMQAWLMWGVVAAAALAMMLREWRGLARAGVALILLVVLGIGLIYPSFAFSDRARRPEGQALELDGSRLLPSDELAAIDWLRQAPPAPLAEAVGNSYSAYGRMSVNSGQAAVMGWPGHEGQWRGGSVDFGPRIGDIATLYGTADWDTVQAILEKYGVGYVVVGGLERSTYAVDVGKFQRNLEVGFQNDSVTIYLVP